VGRHGETLVLDIQGSDPAAQTTEADVKLLDANGAPVIAFDTNWDGKPDAAETILHFDQPTVGQKAFTTTITLPELYASLPSIASATVALSNVWHEMSTPITATLVPQAVADMNASCDPKEIDNRCPDGAACTGTTPTCQPADPPSFTHVAYYGSPNPAEVFEGANPAGALSIIDVSFFDNAGNPVNVDLGNGTLTSSVALQANGAADPTFSFVSNPAQNFTTSVAKITATPVDSLRRAGPPVSATLAQQPAAATGRACDPSGYIGCFTGNACSPGIAGQNNLCGGIPTLQAAKCAAATTSTTAGFLAAWGVAQGVSLWDPPTGCTLPTEINEPEALVTLKLAKAVATLTVSTATPETNFDTVVYIVPSCATSSAQAIGCNDDTQGFTSTVTAMNVAAGTYTIVVDSANSIGGQFGLTVTTQ
jgi:hypothetical protein